MSNEVHLDRMSEMSDEARLDLIIEALKKSPLLASFLARGFWDAHHVDLVWRHNGRDVREEGDWLKDVWYLVRRQNAPALDSRAELYRKVDAAFAPKE
jgi:hypothetical protein